MVSGCEENHRNAKTILYRMFCAEHHYQIYDELLKEIEDAKILCRIANCTRTASTYLSFCYTHMQQQPELERDSLSDKEIEAEIEKALEREGVKKAIASPSGYNVGVTSDISQRLSGHRQTSDCDGLTILFHAKDREEGSRAERVAINLFALHKDENVRNGLCNGHGGGMNWSSIEMKQSRAYVYILFDRFGVKTPGSCIENPFRRGNLEIDELKRVIASCVENVRECGGNDAFKIGLTAHFDHRMCEYNGYPGYKVLERSQFLDCAIFRGRQNGAMKLADFRLLEQGVICACAADEELSNRVLNVTGGGDYFWKNGDDERELVLYIRFGKKGLTTRKIQDIIYAAGKKSRAATHAKKVAAVAQSSTAPPSSAAVLSSKQLVIKENGTIDYRQSFPVEDIVLKLGMRLKRRRIVEQKYQCGCGRTFARNNALCAHIRAMNMAPEEQLECDLIDQNEYGQTQESPQQSHRQQRTGKNCSRRKR
jgi:hypothetical protein